MSTPKEHPILFSGPMVRAIFYGRKTQTRRLNARWAKRKVGDVLWVRETWRPLPELEGCYEYRATSCDEDGDDGQWKPSIFMPREACRLRLQVTEVRTERLQEITFIGSNAEGFGDVLKFAELWDSINNKPGQRWADNPEVAVIGFERIDG